MPVDAGPIAQKHTPAQGSGGRLSQNPNCPCIALAVEPTGADSIAALHATATRRWSVIVWPVVPVALLFFTRCSAVAVRKAGWKRCAVDLALRIKRKTHHTE